MSVYLICFTIVLFFSYINETNNLRKKPNKVLNILTAAIIVLLPAIVAGLRDFSIGKDVTVYAKTVFEYSCTADSVTSMVQRFSGIEYGYLFFTYIISRISADTHFYLFAVSLFINTWMYLALYRSRKITSIFMGESVFLFLLYNQSLNIMRQSMAMVILLFALTFLYEKRIVKTLLFMGISLLFHQTAIIGFLYIPIFLFINKHNVLSTDTNISKNKKRLFAFETILIIISVVVLSSLFLPLMNIFSSSGLLDSKYLQYLTESSYEFKLKFLIVFILPTPLIFYRRNKNKFGYELMAIEATNVILYQLRTIMYYLFRISSWFMIGRVLSLSQTRIDIMKIIRTGRVSKEEIQAIIAFIVCFGYWWSFIVINNDNGTVPYKFYW